MLGQSEEAGKGRRDGDSFKRTGEEKFVKLIKRWASCKGAWQSGSVGLGDREAVMPH